MPPQSPVAWSNFITGTDAGGHGIFDFVHRDPETMLPYLSTSKTEDASRVLKLGKYEFSMSGGEVELLRHGTPFWEVLEDHGIETTIIRIPANFPTSGTASREISGMGTPDLLGGYGTFSYYTTDRLAFQGQDISGGDVYQVTVEEQTGSRPALRSRPSDLAGQRREDRVPGLHGLPRSRPAAAKLVVGTEERILEEGEWSDWVTVEFDLIPTQAVGPPRRSSTSSRCGPTSSST